MAYITVGALDKTTRIEVPDGHSMDLSLWTNFPNVVRADAKGDLIHDDLTISRRSRGKASIKSSSPLSGIEVAKG